MKKEGNREGFLEAGEICLEGGTAEAMEHGQMGLKKVGRHGAWDERKVSGWRMGKLGQRAKLEEWRWGWGFH